MQELRIKKSVVIIGCPRSGTSLLFTLLNKSSHLWSLYREANDVWTRFYKFSHKEFIDDVLCESDLNSEAKKYLLNEFHKHSLNNYYIGYLVREYLVKDKLLNNFMWPIAQMSLLYKLLFKSEYNLIEKTPKNCFRIPFINKLFDNCKFIFLKRDGKTNINSLIEGWRHPKIKYLRPEFGDLDLNITGYSGQYWNFVFPPNWRNYTDKPLEEVCAFQWLSSNKAVLEGLKTVDANKVFTISYEELTRDTYETIKKICEFIHIPFSKNLKEISMDPPAVNFVTKPHKEKWKNNIELIEKTYPIIEPMMKELGYSLS